MPKKCLTTVPSYLKTVKQDLQFSRETLEKAMIQQSALYYQYACLFAKAQGNLKSLELRLEHYESARFRELEEHHSRPTERMLHSYCHQQKIWLVLKQKINKAMVEVDDLKTICRAFEHRKDMLVNLSATLRAEMDSEVTSKTRNRR